MKNLFLFVAWAIPLVSSQGDLKGCITSVATNVIHDVGIAGTMIDFTQCIMNGTVGQCQFQCAMDINACMPARDPQCLNIQFQECINTCINNANFMNEGCYSTALDVLTTLPANLGKFAAFYQIYTGCVDVVQYGISWTVDVIKNAINNAATAIGGAVWPIICSYLQSYLPLPICSS